jgi:hypothetical protein
MDSQVVLPRLREFLGSTCDRQLRLVSTSVRDAMAMVPVKKPKVKDYLTSVELFQWAASVLKMPVGDSTLRQLAKGVHFEVVRWYVEETPGLRVLFNHFNVCTNAAAVGHLEFVKWLRAHDPPFALGGGAQRVQRLRGAIWRC